MSVQASRITFLNVLLLKDGGVGELKDISRSDTHLVKALPPIFFKAVGNSMRINPLQSRNAALPICVQAAGIIIVVSDVHFSKALFPMLDMEMGRLTA